MVEDFGSTQRDVTPQEPARCRKGHTLRYEFYSDGSSIFAVGPWCDCVEDIIPPSFYRVDAFDTPHSCIPKAKELGHERGKCTLCKSPVVYRYEWHSTGEFFFSPARGYCKCAGKSLDAWRVMAGVATTQEETPLDSQPEGDSI